jgi:scyllo-inositol 2-dehydrogenase (NADP+)
MRVVVVGLGVQGYKRRQAAGADFVAAVDPINTQAEYRRIEDVPLGSYDAALACIPDKPKLAVLQFLLANGKHVLIEKPLWAPEDRDIDRLGGLARENGAVCYTAYNHRFEPHFMRMRDVIRSGRLGAIYRCRMFYGNGTARLVRDSQWRDQDAGVLPDLGSHLIDTVRFWFGDIGDDLSLISSRRFENRAPDHVVIASPNSTPQLELEMTLVSWRNHFSCDVLAENGSAHIDSLCKWGPSSFTTRMRVLPSGRPPEETLTIVQDDPTWVGEYKHFKRLCAEHCVSDLANDVWLNRILRRLGQAAMIEARQ